MRFPTRGTFRGVVRLCPYPAAFSGSGVDSSVFASGSVTGSSVAQIAVGQLPCGVVSNARCTSPSCSFPPPTGEFLSPVVRNVQATRLDVVRDGFRGQGFSTRAAGFLAQSLRPSTSLVYDRKWDIFCTWCTERQIDPVSIPIGDLGDFLSFLFEDLHLAASTVRAYKAAILSALSPRQILPRHSWGRCINCALFFIVEIRRILLLFLLGILGSFFARYL